MTWMNELTGVVARLGQALFAGLFLRVGPCHFDFEMDRRGRGPAALD